MNTQEKIKEYIDSQPEQKCKDMYELHRVILELMPDTKFLFFDGKDNENKTISNPNIGYGQHTISYSNGKSREFYKIGLSANKTGISVYIFGIDDKTYLTEMYSQSIGKAKVSGYCIKFKSLKDINIEILKDAIKFGF